MDRRAFLTTALAGAAGAAVHAQTPPQISSVPSQRDWNRLDPIQYPDPDIIALDPRFRRYIVGNTAIRRLHFGTQWAEGPAWNGVGSFLVWSDIPNNVQMRWTEEDGRVTMFRNPSGYSNGNTFDFQGRQISCEHGGRRVVRRTQRHDDRHRGSIRRQAAQLPNDVAVSPDGSIWFTDPTSAFAGNYEGFKSEQETKEAVYRVDPQTRQVAKVTDDRADRTASVSRRITRSCTSPTRAWAGTSACHVDGKSLRNGQRFIQLDIPGTGAPSAADGIRCDVDGNIWAGARPGVQVVAADGTRIGMIRLPETCANVCFGGSRRNRLFMAASESLYAVYVETQGAHFA
jgi:gluconolactonase